MNETLNSLCWNDRLDFVKQLDKLEFSGECKVKLSLKTNTIKSFGKTVENDIKSLEKVLNIKFPNDYKDFLLKTNGGSIPNDNTNEIVLKNIENYKYRYSLWS